MRDDGLQTPTPTLYGVYKVSSSSSSSLSSWTYWYVSISPSSRFFCSTFPSFSFKIFFFWQSKRLQARDHLTSPPGSATPRSVPDHLRDVDRLTSATGGAKWGDRVRGLLVGHGRRRRDHRTQMRASVPPALLGPVGHVGEGCVPSVPGHRGTARDGVTVAMGDGRHWCGASRHVNGFTCMFPSPMVGVVNPFITIWWPLTLGNKSQLVWVRCSKLSLYPFGIRRNLKDFFVEKVRK